VLQFLNPALLLGCLALAVPLIIHLLNRQRYRRRPWAAMEFLLAAYKKQRRRLRTENLLLLLLRCLIPVAVALAISRPVLRDAPGVASLSSTAHHVLLLDDTYSMGREPEGAPSPFQRMKTLAARLLDRIEKRSGHKVTVVTSGVRVATPIVDDLGVARAKARIAGMPAAQDAARDLTEALLKVADIVEGGTDPEFRVYLFSDLQARAFGLAQRPVEPGAGRDEPTPPEPAAAARDDLHDALARILKLAEITVFDVGVDTAGTNRADNLQVSELALGVPVATVGVTIPVVATLVNRTQQAQSVQCTLEVDGGSPTRKAVDLEPGAERQVEFTVTLREVGLRALRASIEADGLEADNARYRVVPARERIQVLLVEGSDVSETPDSLREATHLRDVLDPTRGRGAPELTTFAPKIIDTTTFWRGTENFAAYDLIVLANVERVSRELAEKLASAVQAGAGLLFLLGDYVDPDAYNVELGSGGRGLLPLRLTGPRGYTPGGTESYGSEILQPHHPIFADLGDAYRDLFQQVAIYRFLGSDPASLSPAATLLCRVRDDAQSPLLAVAPFGNGKVAVLTTPINRRPDRWNDLNLEVIAFQLLHPLAYWLTVPAVDPHNVEVGTPLSASVPERPRDVAYVLSERAGGERVPVAEDARALPGERFALPPLHGTAYAGIYAADIQVDREGSIARRQLPFAVNVDPREGDLTYMTHAACREKLGLNRIYRDLPAEGNVSIEAGISELGPLLLWVVLAIVVGEAVLARFVSSRRN
jgi:hypothetical protein